PAQHRLTARLGDGSDHIEAIIGELPCALADIDLVAATYLIDARHRAGRHFGTDLIGIAILVDDQDIIVAILVEAKGGVVGARPVVAPALIGIDRVCAADLAKPRFVADILRKRTGRTDHGQRYASEQLPQQYGHNPPPSRMSNPQR